MMAASKLNVGMGYVPLRVSNYTVWRMASRISRKVWRLTGKLLRTLYKHWQVVIVLLSLTLPILLFLWIFVSLNLSHDSRSIALHLSWNTPQETLARFVRLVNLQLYDDQPYLHTLADAAAQRHGIDPTLFRALIMQESAWDTHALSARGAAGLTQLMPSTAADHCGLQAEERFDAVKNLDCGAQYFAHQLRRFKAVDLALAAYNAGPSRVAKLGRIPRIAETEAYVTRIIENWQSTANAQL